MALVIVLVCEILLIVAASYMVFSWLTQTPFYPSSVKQLNKLIDNGQIPLPKTDIRDISFVDIGSGDGRFVVWALKKGFNRAEGIEYNPFLFLFSKLKLIFLGLSKKGKIYKKNFRYHKYDKYNLAYLYIFSEQMQKIQEKLFSEMPKGSIIITNTFTFRDLQPFKKVDRFYVYKVV